MLFPGTSAFDSMCSFLCAGGVRGVGLISGAGLTSKGVTLNGLVHAADWMPTILSAVTAGPLGATWKDMRDAAGEPPVLLGDGMDLWPYLSGQMAQSMRTEVLHEAHQQGSSDGNGNALRVGDYKIVLRTGSQWSSGSHFGSNDGWYGGPMSTDSKTGPYCVSSGQSDEDWIVKCPPPPANVTANFACEKAKGAAADAPEFACLFNIRSDPCEQVDLSSTQPAKVASLLARLEAFRATAVDSRVAHPNPDGHSCPGNAIATAGLGTPSHPGGCDPAGPGSNPMMNCSTVLPCTLGAPSPSPVSAN